MSESTAINYLGRPLNDKEIQARKSTDYNIDNYIADIYKITKILSDNNNNERVMFILDTDTNYFRDKMVIDEQGNEYYVQPRYTEITFRVISRDGVSYEIVSIIGNGTNISPWLFDQVTKLFLIEFRWRFNLLRMPESAIVEHLGRPLNDKEILAKKEVDGYIRDKVSRDKVSDKIRNSQKNYNKNRPTRKNKRRRRDKVS